MPTPKEKFQRPLSSATFRRWRSEGWLVPMLTCYDAPSARVFAAAGVPLLLVGDSVGPVLLGLESVRDVTLDMIIHHTGAVRRGAADAVIVSDLPAGSFDTPAMAVASAGRLVKAGADMVKIEASAEEAEIIRALVDAGVFVMGHVGHKPQSYHSGPRVTGASGDQAAMVLRDAVALAAEGASVILMECVPGRVAAEISRRLDVPTIGIGSGPGCGGQVLVSADLLGWFDNRFRFLVKLDDFASRAAAAAGRYAEMVRQGKFPAEAQTFRISDREFDQFLRTTGV